MGNPPKPGPPAKPDAPVITTDDTAALSGASAAPVKKTAGPAKRRRIVVSQGAFEDLTRLRKVTDPGTGYTLRVGHDGTVTAYNRGTGQPVEDIDVICPTVPPVQTA
jgi:hypothetical protein